ncbi:MAG TPA: PatB family C-S lyase [Candidatus Sabulitectum sp.]|nr:PatB family C-S lyase [Candidatus Sabulitectum sp.]HPF32399.1 PatB family C-S lyase [Candidatus Sabulitectum sp.]HPJ27844.1 PatB family C-S lyase [Candidatus Sabulitectum sp.]HPR21988.1 PatB family C-S lyase [Candidatus Sabulitectum sp.]
MKHNFDTPIDRSGTSCLKWDYLQAFFGKEDLNALWVADMDFKTPPEILEPLIERAKHGVFGYTAKPEGFYQSVIQWFLKRYGWSIERDWIVATPGVVPALNLAIQTFTEPGEGIIIQPPVYFPFEESIRLNERRVLNNQLLLNEDRYVINFEDLERRAGNASMLVLCSPHNPVSRVWTREELEEIGRICRQNDLMVFSDEIHADIVFPPHRHMPTAAVNEFLRENSICAYATSKTFNLAGLQLSVNIIPQEVIRNRFKESLAKLHMNMSNIFGIVGTQAAYANGGEWLDQLLEYLWGNYLEVASFLRSKIPGISVLEPQGTFLLWLDCRGLGLSDDELASLFVNRAKLALSGGSMFGPGGEGFMRMNIACPRKNLMDALSSLEKALDDDSPLPAEPPCCSGGPDDT